MCGMRSSTASRAQMPSKRDRKSTRLNSSHPSNSYAVFCLKKKKPGNNHDAPCRHIQAQPVQYVALVVPISQYLHLEFFFFNDPAPTGIYTLSLHDALPILPLGSAVPALDCQPDAGIHRRLLPCRRATAASLCPSPCAHRWRARTPTGTPPRPATTSRRRACPPPNGRGGRRRVASHHHHHHHPVDEVGASSTRQPRQGTPQPFPLASPTGHYKPAAESPAPAAGVHC